MHRTPMETEWLGQGQPPRIMNRLRDIRKLVRGSTRRRLSRRSAHCSQGRRRALRAVRRYLPRGSPVRGRGRSEARPRARRRSGRRAAATRTIIAAIRTRCRARQAPPCSCRRPAPPRAQLIFFALAASDRCTTGDPSSTSASASFHERYESAIEARRRLLRLPRSASSRPVHRPRSTERSIRNKARRRSKAWRERVRLILKRD